MKTTRSPVTESNRRPSPYHVDSGSKLNCCNPGQDRFRCCLGARRCPWFPPRSGTRLARPAWKIGDRLRGSTCCRYWSGPPNAPWLAASTPSSPRHLARLWSASPVPSRLRPPCAATSSRSQVPMRAARAAACLTWQASSVYVRWRPPLSVVIVTQLATRWLAGRCREPLLRRSSGDGLLRFILQLSCQAEVSGDWPLPPSGLPNRGVTGTGRGSGSTYLL